MGQPGLSTEAYSGVKLNRILGFPAAYGAAVGLVVSGTAMVSVGSVAGLVGKASFITALIALIPMMCAALAFSELTAMLPGGGMIGEYTLPAMGRLVSMFAVISGYIVLIACDGGTQQVIAGQSIESLIGIPQPVVSWALLLIILAVNLFGVGFYGKSESVITITMMSIFVLMSILGAMGVGQMTGAKPLDNIPEFAITPAVFSSVGIAIWWFIGFEFACPMAEEFKEPWKTIPMALIAGLISIYLVDVIFVWAATNYTPVEILATSSIPHVEAAKHMLGQVGFVIMSLITVFAAFTTANSYMAGMPRMLYGLAREKLLPSFFGYIHPKYRTPWVGILFTAFLIGLVLVYATFKDADITLILDLILTACITWMVAYSIAMIDVLILRQKYPNFERKFRAPFVWITMPIGLAAVVYAIMTIHPDPVVAHKIQLRALVIMAVIAAWGVFWLKRQGLPLFKRVSLEEVHEQIVARSE